MSLVRDTARVANVHGELIDYNPRKQCIILEAC